MSSVLANNISGKVVVITGGSSGLGETTARHLASLGASVVLGARRIDKLEAIAADIRTAGGEVAVQATDVTTASDHFLIRGKCSSGTPSCSPITITGN